MRSPGECRRLGLESLGPDVELECRTSGSETLEGDCRDKYLQISGVSIPENC